MNALRTLLAVCAGLALSTMVIAQPAWKPERTVEMIVPTAAGGGNDKTARVLNRIWQAMGVQTAVSNRTGGGGATAYAYLNQRRGDAMLII